MSDTPAAFARHEMLPAEAPPASESGIVGWLRENLFGSWFDGVMTVIALALVGAILWSAVPWLTFNSVWNASSLSDCRTIMDESYGQGVRGACWAVIKERWHQLLFGFYPAEFYWRPTLAFGLLFLALAPVLFNSFPRPMLIFSALYPFVLYFLVWGGTIWGPLLVIAGLGLIYYAYVQVEQRVSALAGIGAAVLALLVWFLYLLPALGQALAGAVPIGLTPVSSDKFGGFLLAIIIGLTGIGLSLPIGIALALARKSDLFMLNVISVGLIEFIRGVPLIGLLFVAQTLLNYFLPPQTEFDLVLRVIIMVTLFASAYMAEVIRGGLAALPRGQYEAADALGLDYFKAHRLIILPQALKISIPGIANTFIGLFKDTTLVVFIGLSDPLKGMPDKIRADTAWQGIFWEIFIFSGVIFFIFCFGISRYSQYLERKLATDRR